VLRDVADVDDRPATVIAAVWSNRAKRVAWQINGHRGEHSEAFLQKQIPGGLRFVHDQSV